MDATLLYKSIQCLKQPGGKTGKDHAPQVVIDEEREQKPEEEKFIICRQCRQAITRPRDRITVQGSHHHTFANPHGLVFDIGCFKNVQGCGYAGPASDEFTWFAGYSWRVGFCRVCLTHLGWIFLASSGDSFHGLILDRLLEPD